MTTMRSKLRVSDVRCNSYDGVKTTSVSVSFNAVGPKGSYPEDGSDENNTFAKWTPTAYATYQITNPALFEAFKVGEEYYVDFVKASD